MKKHFRSLLGWILGIAVAGCVVQEMIPSRLTASRLEKLPLSGLGYAGRDLPLTEAEATVFQRTPVLKRLYRAGSDCFVLLAVDGRGDLHAIHDPLYCFRGAGWAIASEAAVKLPGGHGKIVRLCKGLQTAEAMYWVTDGKSRHTSALKTWWQSVTDRLGGHKTARGPVLVLLQPVTGTTVNWQDLLNRFHALSTI